MQQFFFFAQHYIWQRLLIKYYKNNARRCSVGTKGTSTWSGLTRLGNQVNESPIKVLMHLQPLRIYTYLQHHKNKSILLIGHPPVIPTCSMFLELKNNKWLLIFKIIKKFAKSFNIFSRENLHFFWGGLCMRYVHYPLY